MSALPPRISVVITAYNSEAFLRDAIESVLRQTLLPSEIVVIDDGSIDETAQIAQEYSEVGVRYIWQENQGEGAARNRGIQETTGEWVAFLDADDIWLDYKLQHQIEYAQSHLETGMVSGYKWWWQVEDNYRYIVRYGQVPAKKLYRELTVNNIVGCPSLMLMKREVLEKAGLFRTDLRYGTDWEMWLRMAKFASIGFVNVPLIIYRWHASNVSTQYKDHRVSDMENISSQAIGSVKPAIVRLVLHARVKSKSQLILAHAAMDDNQPRAKQFKCALSAFLWAPFDTPGKKIRLILRSILGGKIYHNLKGKHKNSNEITREPFVL